MLKVPHEVRMPRGGQMRLVQAILTVVLAGAAANAAAVQPGNSGFEEVGPRGIPRGWTPAGSPGSVVAADQQVKRAGNASLRLENPTPGALNAVSEPVTLEVGQAVSPDRLDSDREGFCGSHIPISHRRRRHHDHAVVPVHEPRTGTRGNAGVGESLRFSSLPPPDRTASGCTWV